MLAKFTASCSIINNLYYKLTLGWTANKMSDIYDEVYQIVCLIPKGRIATYGQIARLIGRPRNARQVGYALSALPDKNNIPWHRVMNSRGEISTRRFKDYENYQQILLEDEGVEFEISGRVNLNVYQWKT
jgi:methylated-DNA-protein-cysteine methyltransferase-like protein